jgi:diacylglycerol kinase (ATP)
MIFVVNPAAGRGRAGRKWPDVERRLRSSGLDFEVVLTKSAGDATHIAHEAAAEHRMVVAVGGDGTVNEVVNGLLDCDPGSRPRLGVIPLGTGTDLCRGFAIPLHPLAAAGVLTGGAPRTIDAGRVTCAGPHGLLTRHFVNIADAGIGGDVADFVNSGFKVVNGAITFSLAAVITLMRWRNPVLEVDLDGETMRITAQQIVVANSQYYGGGMRIAPQAEPDDGLFDVVINGNLGKIETLRLIGQVRNGSHMRHPKLERRLARRVEVRSGRRVGVDLDGERPGDLPAVFEVVPGAIDLMVPRG